MAMVYCIVIMIQEERNVTMNGECTWKSKETCFVSRDYTVYIWRHWNKGTRDGMQVLTIAKVFYIFQHHALSLYDMELNKQMYLNIESFLCYKHSQTVTCTC